MQHSKLLRGSSEKTSIRKLYIEYSFSESTRYNQVKELRKNSAIYFEALEYTTFISILGHSFFISWMAKLSLSSWCGKINLTNVPFS